MMEKRYILLPGMALILSVSCLFGQNPVPDTLPEADGKVQKEAVIKELPLPRVPRTMTGPEERAAYILEHFWDGMDFRDTLYCRDRDFMEQNMVNFFSLFPHTAPQRLPNAIEQLLERATTDREALGMIAGIAEQYLSEPDSPMRNEEYHIAFLEQLLCTPGLPETERLRSEYLLETKKKNRPGTAAADFAYITRQGEPSCLYSTTGESLLLLFYDPACGHCMEIVDELRHSEPLRDLIRKEKMTVLAIYTEGNRLLWDETKNAMPKDWEVGFDSGNIVECGLYPLLSMPVIYLLDKNKTVLLKAPTLSTLKEYLSDRL